MWGKFRHKHLQCEIVSFIQAGQNIFTYWESADIIWGSLDTSVDSQGGVVWVAGLAARTGGAANSFVAAAAAVRRLTPSRPRLALNWIRDPTPTASHPPPTFRLAEAHRRAAPAARFSMTMRNRLQPCKAHTHSRHSLGDLRTSLTARTPRNCQTLHWLWATRTVLKSYPLRVTLWVSSLSGKRTYQQVSNLTIASEYEMVVFPLHLLAKNKMFYSDF